VPVYRSVLHPYGLRYVPVPEKHQSWRIKPWPAYFDKSLENFDQLSAEEKKLLRKDKESGTGKLIKAIAQTTVEGQVNSNMLKWGRNARASLKEQKWENVRKTIAIAHGDRPLLSRGGDDEDEDEDEDE
jgi:hypothetical protein